MMHWLSPYPLVTDGVSTELFMFVVGGMASAILGLAGAMQRSYSKHISELETANAEKDELIAELRDTLTGYGTVGPELVQQIEALVRQAGLSSPPTSSMDSHGSTSLPFPYERSRITPQRPRRTGDR